MQPVSSMLSRLDVETREYHADVDGYWLDLMASGVTRAHYTTQLVRVYGFEAPVESAFLYTPQLVISDRRERTRTGLIAQDLLALGMSPAKIASLPQCPGIAPFEDPAEALGWKYVIERPAQLHGAIKRNLVARVADIANACAYVSASDGIAAARWQQFGLLLDDVARRPAAAERIIHGANQAFVRMRDWFRQVSAN